MATQTGQQTTSVEFLGPYNTEKVLAAVIKAIPIKRPNWCQTFFMEVPPTNKMTVNFDQEYQTKNVMGTFAEPKADVSPLRLPTYGHKELTFSYAKEDIDSDDFSQLNVRQIGEQFGLVDIMRNKATRFLRKMVLAEQRFENLFEYCASQIAMFGGYKAESQYHHKVVYDFARPMVTTANDLYGVNALQLIPCTNLTTAEVDLPNGNTIPVVATDITATDGTSTYTAGMKKWTKANVDAGTATPVIDFTLMVQTCNELSRASAVHMSDDAYQVFNHDVQKNYKDAATLIISSIHNISLDVTPILEVVKGLTFRRMWTFANGISVPIYTYNAVYHDRVTGAEVKYVGPGWVIVFPEDGGMKVHGRIMHPKANYEAQARFINYWMNPKSGLEEWEIHTSFIMGHTIPTSLVSWKVC